MENTFKKLEETETTDIRGASVTSYGLQPVTYIKEVIDGAKNEMQFVHWVREVTLPKGTHQISLPKRTQYLGYHGGTWNYAGTDTGGFGSSGTGVGPYHNTIADISWQTISNLSNVTATPGPILAGSAVRNFDIDTNVVNMLQFVKEDLMYQIADRIEYDIASTIGDATDATSTAAGAQTLFGGDATSDNGLSTGDVLTTDLIAKAVHYLEALKFRYRASTGYGVESAAAVSSYRKNPWRSTNNDPFVLFIGPAQAEALRKDSQFVNASEYGDNTIIKNGEIGKIKYLGVRIVVANQVEQVSSGGVSPDGNSTTGADMSRCILMKAKAACALVWGKKPEIRVWDYNERDEKRIGLYTYYSVVVVHPDAIVFLDVTDA